MPILPGTRYEFHDIEKRWRELWEKSGIFSPENSPENSIEDSLENSPENSFTKDKGNGAASKEKSFSIVIPPPNITGELHVGHALNQTIQDVSVRAARKQGLKTLWLPGTDHAGIAAQVRVERELRKQGGDRQRLGRKKFVEKVWEWKEQSGSAIGNQQRLMGFSLDWSRERFTMDPELSLAVRQVFVELYREGLIYREKRMVNWDPESRTVLSELEVEYDENFSSELYSFAYPLAHEKGSEKGKEIVVATTRPETMLGDTAVAVHPQDERYKHLIGSFVIHPFLDRKIKIIGDDVLVDPKFGSGAVKLTPAHDPNDFEAAKRHNLELIHIFDEAACITSAGGKFAGMERFAARKAVKEELERLGLSRGSKTHTMSIGRSQRSGVIIEPIVSTQWFVKVKPLAKKAKQAVQSGEIKIFPQQWENTYFHWMDNIRDWCISRQLWWGHRIPVWYGPDEKIFAAKDEKEAQALAKEHYKKAVPLRQDPDVLDTWFSSALWPFSTLGWPKKTKDLSTYYPTTLLVTGFDIIFFWVARMIMMGLHFMKKPPFETVYIHGLMRDEKGKKMSKTVGNVVDPIQSIEQYGTDAFRFFLMSTLHEGKDSLYSEHSLRGCQNFANKIWNSSRFILMNLPENFQTLTPEKILLLPLESEDFWILSRLNYAAAETARILRSCKFHLSTEAVYTFFWHEFCDWYIEFIKPRVFGQSTAESAVAALQTVCFVMKNALGLLNPFMPFITEEIFSFFQFSQESRDPEQKKFLALAPWPLPLSLPKNAQTSVQALGLLQEAARSIRLIRSQTGIPPHKKIKVILRSCDQDLKKILAEKEAAVQRLVGSSEIRIQEEYKPEQGDAMEPFSCGEVYVSQKEGLDPLKEKERLENELKKLHKQIETARAKLANKNFIENAPPPIVKKEEEKLQGFLKRESALTPSLKRLLHLLSETKQKK